VRTARNVYTCDISPHQNTKLGKNRKNKWRGYREREYVNKRERERELKGEVGRQRERQKRENTAAKHNAHTPRDRSIG